MTLNEFVKLEITAAKAFILGLIFPLYTEKTAKDGKTYILGAVRHKANHVSEDDILEHHKTIKKFLREYNLAEKIQIVANQTEEYGNFSRGLRGFSILLEKEKSESFTDSFNKIFLLVKNLENESIEIKRFFLKGVFDGRGSIDTNSHLIVVDYKLPDNAFETFSNIIISLGFEITPNKRHSGEGRNAQFRIKTNSLEKFRNEIGFFSIRRKKYLDDMIKNLNGEN